ncbi:MAG: hypothetical protein ACR2LK_00825 [Solirubrobacteraceae bacterium]
MVQRIGPHIWLDEEHMWYQLDLAARVAPDFGTLELVTPRAPGEFAALRHAADNRCRPGC